MKQNDKTGREPYYHWKIINMVLACAVILIVLLTVLGEQEKLLVPIAFFLGTLMCALSGIMELAKGKRIVGYISSVSAGIFMVALIISIVRIWW